MRPWLFSQCAVERTNFYPVLSFIELLSACNYVFDCLFSFGLEALTRLKCRAGNFVRYLDTVYGKVKGYKDRIGVKWRFWAHPYPNALSIGRIYL